jgi:hypothetical protein
MPMLCAAILAFCAAVGAAASAPRLHFVSPPLRVIAGNPVTVAVSGGASKAPCTLAVRYADGSHQQGLHAAPLLAGKAIWSWIVPDTAQAGVARMTSSCPSTAKAGASFLVVGSLVPPRISVEKDGFSVRTRLSGTDDVSYGVLLKNQSSNADAKNVSVLVNFVLASGRLLGSTSSIVPVLPAGSTYPLGGNLSFPGAAPIARLEVVIQVGAHARHAGRAPALDSVVIEPSTYDPGWVGDVAGEVINNDGSLVLQRAQLSAVILDADGNVLGGGSGMTSAALPPGTRVVFKLTGTSFSDIPFARAASVVVIAVPTWQQAAA